MLCTSNCFHVSVSMAPNQCYQYSTLAKTIHAPCMLTTRATDSSCYWAVYVRGVMPCRSRRAPHCLCMHHAPDICAYGLFMYVVSCHAGQGGPHSAYTCTTRLGSVRMGCYVRGVMPCRSRRAPSPVAKRVQHLAHSPTQTPPNPLRPYPTTSHPHLPPAHPLKAPAPPRAPYPCHSAQGVGPILASTQAQWPHTPTQPIHCMPRIHDVVWSFPCHHHTIQAVVVHCKTQVPSHARAHHQRTRARLLCPRMVARRGAAASRGYRLARWSTWGWRVRLTLWRRPS